MEWNKDNPLRVATLCSGYDSQCLALEQIKEFFPPFDYDLVLWSEFDPESKQPLESQPAVVAHNALFPQWADRNYGDMTKIDWANAPDIDLLFYSTPCFVAGTLVLTDKGPKPIESIVTGDKVLTHKNRFRRVVTPMCHPHNGILYTIRYRHTEKVTCTEEHPFYVRTIEDSTPRWVMAKNLRPDSLLAYPTQSGIEWISIDIIEYSRQSVPVYNMEVEEDNSYTANGVIVHNCQDFSNAGRQRGAEEGSATRSSILWYTRNAIIAKRPKYAIMENVKAVVSDKFVRLFRKWEQELASYGYTNYCKVLNAKDYGYPEPVPQNRERIFLVSVRDEDDHFRFPEPMELTKRLKDVLEPHVDERYYLDDEKVQKFVAHCDKKQMEGCGFKFEPSEGGGEPRQ